MEVQFRDDDPHEALFDEFLDLALDGAPVEPEAFLASRGCDDAALRERLVSLHAELCRQGPGGGAGVAAEPGLPFERIGRFRLLRRLEQGGMGTVFVAEQEGLGRRVALKVIRAELRGSEPAAARFDREVQTLAKLRHPNVVTVLEAGRQDDVRYLAMEYVEGRDLDAILEEARAKGAPLPPSRVVRWGEKLARALAATHARGVIHRDVKPSNVRVTPDDEPTLLDFGIAHEQGTAGLTLTGPFVGTPLYAAPEQIAGGKRAESDARVDVYGLGATLYECLTGRTPRPGGTVDQVLHHALHEDPVPPRQLVPALSRDLETVVMKALEREPSRRYATAAELAEDLLALAEVRPVRARPPGSVRRVAQWGRKHRVAATAAALVVVVAATAAAVRVASAVAQREQRQEDARSALAEARTMLGELQQKEGAAYPLDKAIADMLRRSASHHLDADAEELLWRHQGEVERLRVERERLFHAALARVRRAERLDPELAGTDALRGELFVQRSHEADRRANRPESAHYREAALALDADGSIRDALIGQGFVTIASEPPGADVHVFRYRELAELFEGAPRRLVPVAIGDDPCVVPPGTFGLRVVAECGELHAEDLVVAVAGDEVTQDTIAGLRSATSVGTVVRVVRDGELHDATLGDGVLLRPTAAPLLPRPGCHIGTTPIVRRPLAPGSYVALLRAPGHEPRRVVFMVGSGGMAATTGLDVRLHPHGTTPPGFVLVEGRGASAVGTDHPMDEAVVERRAFWMMDREVTAAEYLEFLNDPATRAAIDASDVPTRVPRDRGNAADGGWWPRGEDGLFSIDPEWSPDWPIVGVSYEDAEAYARWFEGSLGRDDLAIALPTFREWVIAGEGNGDRDYVFGSVFWPRWISSCYARPKPGLAPVMSFPIDESPMGILDLSGNAQEWLDDWWGSGQQQRRLGGGSWAQARREIFKVSGGTGARPASGGGESGFRLVARQRSAGERR